MKTVDLAVEMWKKANQFSRRGFHGSANALYDCARLIMATQPTKQQIEFRDRVS